MRRGVVCGMNGATYESECAAWADRVYVDYFGKCHAVGQLLSKYSLRVCVCVCVCGCVCMCVFVYKYPTHLYRVPLEVGKPGRLRSSFPSLEIL